MRIAMLVWNEFLNDARVLKEAQTLQEAGYKVTVFALHAPGQTQKEETLIGGIRVVRVSRHPFALGLRGAAFPASLPSSGRFGTATQLLRIAGRLLAHSVFAYRIVRLRFDLVHAHDVNVLPTAWLAARLSSAKIIYDAHEISSSREGYSSVRRLVGAVEGALMPRVDGCITTTNARAKFFARAYRIARPLVLQNRPRAQHAEVSERVRQELGLSESWPIVLYQGGLQQGRGLARLVRVAALVPQAYFVFIGGGRLDASLRALASELGLEERVRFIPTVALAELPSYTASADIGIQPIENTCLNHYTTDSNKLFEYVQAGLPIVASNLPEIRRVMQTYQLGLLVMPGSTNALVEAVRALVEDKDMRLFHAGRSREAASVLNWEAQESDLLSLYAQVLAPSSKVRLI